MKKVAAVIVNYNKSEFLLNCLENVYKLNESPEYIFVVDNNSSDDSVSQVKKYYPNVTIIENKENIGGAAGFNCGMKKALKTNCDYIYLMDNDIEPHKLALKELKISLENDKSAGAAGSKGLYCFDRSLIWQAGCDFNWFLQIKIHRENGKKDYSKCNKPKNVPYMPAFSLLVKRETIENVGLMDENFYIYMDDADWCFRIKNKKYNIIYVPTSIVWHHVSSDIPSPFSIYYATRNFLYLFKKHCNKQYLPFIYLFSLLKNFIKLIVCIFKRIKYKKGEYKKTIFAFFYAYLDFFSGKMKRNKLF